ncbi:MAG TPA: AAA family ATPase, partial [Spirochaetota bacterium]|nr:AAA family ATPase [Spirochaetota bacterium]
MGFIKATKKQSKLRIALDGASGSGKTYSALTLASSLSKKIAFIDTEKGSAS